MYSLLGLALMLSFQNVREDKNKKENNNDQKNKNIAGTNRFIGKKI
ncbi:conserved hypothetical protein [Xenorhabdus szentirmaii DSM 16338]|uniref:Uncharacterized protein n=1 Tax=Xenorhabdus szentirmaii DSM 16338 TaxID=1427518 RepID=W1J0R5_9GAMM|nr:conserved hypothetical protein [Xenorhabdus szentirmaii DSM 16338]